MAMAKLICEELYNGEIVLRSYTTTLGMAAVFMKSHPGVGKPFWCWDTIPAGKVIGADFANAPLVTNDTQQNIALIDAITAQPQDVLIYQTAVPAPA
jgi:hypothetical protein